jgi:hypothetical protein
VAEEGRREGEGVVIGEEEEVGIIMDLMILPAREREKDDDEGGAPKD